MPQELELSQIVPFAAIASTFVWAFVSKPHHVVNPVTMFPEIHVLPWVLQINFGIAFLLYSQVQGDVFLFVGTIPILMNGLTHTLHWHPFYNKRIRSFHEYLLFFSLLLILITNAATAVYFHDKNSTVQQIGSGVPVVAMAAFTTFSLAIEKWRLLSTSKPKALEVLACGTIFVAAGLWTAYGFWNSGNQSADWTVASSSILWVVFAILHGCMIAFAMFNNGGIEMGWETEEEEDADIVVDRFNREPTIDGYPPMMAEQQSFGGASGSTSRMSMGRGGGRMDQMEMVEPYEYNGNARSRRSGREQQGYAPEFLVNE